MIISLADTPAPSSLWGYNLIWSVDLLLALAHSCRLHISRTPLDLDVIHLSLVDSRVDTLADG